MVQLSSERRSCFQAAEVLFLGKTLKGYVFNHTTWGPSDTVLMKVMGAHSLQMLLI